MNKFSATKWGYEFVSTEGQFFSRAIICFLRLLICKLASLVFQQYIRTFICAWPINPVGLLLRDARPFAGRCDFVSLWKLIIRERTALVSLLINDPFSLWRAASSPCFAFRLHYTCNVMRTSLFFTAGYYYSLSLSNRYGENNVLCAAYIIFNRVIKWYLMLAPRFTNLYTTFYPAYFVQFWFISVTITL